MSDLPERIQELMMEATAAEMVISTLEAERILGLEGQIEPGSFYVGMVIGQLNAAGAQTPKILGTDVVTQQMKSVIEMVRERYATEKSRDL